LKKYLEKYKRPGKIVGIIIILISVYFLGYLIGHKNLTFEKNYKPIIANRELMKPKTVDFSIFWQAWNKIADSYVGTPDYKKMVYGAINGMVEALGDPYSSFMEPDATKSFMEDLSGEISGIGAQIEEKDNKIIIVAPLPGSPAEKIGIKPQDQVVKIDGTDTTNMALNEAIDRIRGKAGTKVKLSVIHSGSTTPVEYEITRETIKVESVNWKMLPGNIGYIQITQFGDDTTDLFKQAAKEIDAKNPKGVIIDLRSNPGGYLETAVDVSSMFDKDKVVVQEKYKDGHIDQSKTNNSDPILGKYKVIVLVDGGSASASEIVAGALQDWGKAKLVGQKTFGKGSVQELENLNGGSTLRITVAKWLTPNGRTIDGTGLEPDYVVEFSQADEDAGKDPQLDKALELLK
jgi:carboxyl-terminal processing protease